MHREDWDRRYAQKELVWTARANQFLVEQVQGLKPGRALDLAAGEGRNAVWLAEQGWTVTAVDFSQVGLDKGRKLAAARNVRVHWVAADLETYQPQPASAELVALLYLHLPWESMRPILRRAEEAVAPGGTFLLVGHDTTNLEKGHGGPPSPEVLYTADQVQAELGLVIEHAGVVTRSVQTESGEKHALDCLVRARRGTAS